MTVNITLARGQPRGNRMHRLKCGAATPAARANAQASRKNPVYLHRPPSS